MKRMVGRVFGTAFIVIITTVATVTTLAEPATAPGGGQDAARQRGRRAPQTDETVAVTRGTRLTIESFAGEVVINTWDRDSLRVQASHSARNKVSVQRRASGIVIESHGTMGPASIDYEITAPAWMPIKVDGTYLFISVEGAQNEVSAKTVRGDILVKGGTGFVTASSIEGEIIVEGARGRINVNAVNQGIKIVGASGEIVAETTNGSITLGKMDAKTVDVATVNGHVTYEGAVADGGRYRLTTHNGNITVTLPPTANATFSVRTYNGSFRSDLPLKGAEDSRRGRRATYTLGNGSAEVELESFGGAIRVRRANGGPTKDRHKN